MPSVATRRFATRIQRHRFYRLFVAVGLVSFGVVYAVLAILALQLAWGDPARQLDASYAGALTQVAEEPLGTALLIIAAAGLYVLVVWQIIEALLGYSHLTGLRRFNRRIGSVGRAIIYFGVGSLALVIALDVRAPGSRVTWDELLTRVMAVEAGRIVVLASGLIVIGVGIGQMGRGLGRIFVDEFEGDVPTWIVVLGMIGYAMLGLSLIVIGFLFSWAAISAQPDFAGTMNTALHFLDQQPFGRWLLSIIAAGFSCFAVFCFAWSTRSFHELGGGQR